jgi:hypothetical protein
MEILETHAAKELLNLRRRIRDEFEEAPGLRLSIDEGARFWGLDENVCELVLSELVDDGFLARGSDHRYRQASRH